MPTYGCLSKIGHLRKWEMILFSKRDIFGLTPVSSCPLENANVMPI
jgi:hypothetical protein